MDIARLLLINGAKIKKLDEIIKLTNNSEFQVEPIYFNLLCSESKSVKDNILNTIFICNNINDKDEFPQEIWMIILSNIFSLKDFNALRHTSKLFHQLTIDNETFKNIVNSSGYLWKDLEKLKNQSIETNELFEPQNNQNMSNIGRCIIN